MTYWIKTRDGKVYKGKNSSGTWKEVERKMPLGAKLYDPYSGRTVIGWGLYKTVLARGQANKQAHTTITKEERSRPSYQKERDWIEKKLKSGISKEQLLNGVGAFSNKKKQRVMQEKRLTEKQYEERYGFLANVYYLLSGGD